MSTSDRIHNIDLIKAIAILFVLVYHSSFYNFDFINDPSTISYIRYFSRAILATCVPLFFFVNGYLIFGKKFDLKKHLRRILHLVLIYVVWAVLKILILMPIRSANVTISMILDSVWNLKWGWNNSLWFIKALFFIYLVFPLLKFVFDKSHTWFYALTVGLIILSLGLDYIPHDDSVAHFCVGGCMFLLKDKVATVSDVRRNVYSLVALIISVSGQFLYGVYMSRVAGEVWNLVWDGYGTIFTFISVLCLYLLSLNYKNENRIIRLVAGNTMGIYLIHELWMFYAMVFVLYYIPTDSLLINVVTGLILLVLSLGVTLLLRKIPYIKALVE